MTEIEPLQLAFEETVIQIISVWKLGPVDLQNATESHSAEHATHTGWYKRTGTFEILSGSERMRREEDAIYRT